MSCKYCDGGCSGYCDTACGDSACGAECDTACSDDCDSSCEDLSTGSCSGGCVNTCTTYCSDYCAYSCSSSCTGSCSETCNNACNSASAASAINQLGANILIGGFIKETDLGDLKVSIENELKRRGKTYMITPYVEPIANNFAYREHIEKFFKDCDAISTAKGYTVSADNIIKISDMTDSIAFVKTLMLQNIK